jgi:hypothetical protein
MKIRAALIAVACLTGGTSVAQHLPDEPLTVQFQRPDDAVTGTYKSTYTNGNLRAKGKLQNGYRTGKWVVCDSTGSTCVKRTYHSPLIYSQFEPNYKPRASTQWLRDNNGLLQLDSLHERAFVYTKRIWRRVDAASNKKLVNASLMQQLVTSLREKGAPVYLPDKGKLVPNPEFFNAPASNPEAWQKDMEITAMVIKEDYFFDQERAVGEFRPVAVTFFAKTGDGAQEQAVFTLYYPEVRLAIGLLNTGVKGQVLDDVLTRRDYKSTVLKESNVNNHNIADYATGREGISESRRIEDGLIEAENELWLHYAHK